MPRHRSRVTPPPPSTAVLERRRPLPAPLAALLLLAGLALAVAAAGQAPPPLAATPGAPPRLIESLEVVTEGAARPAWAPRGDWIAYDAVDSDGYSRLWVARPDGTGRRCLTCTAWDFRKSHATHAAWHPSGRYLVFVLSRPARQGGIVFSIGGAPPGRTLGSDLWAITFDGKAFWNLTTGDEQGRRATSPRFSREGKLLVWSERVASRGGAWGQWVLRVGSIRDKRGILRLSGVKTYRPGAQKLYYEACDFSADDKSILLAGNLEPGATESSLDLYLLDLDTGGVRRLTDTPGALDRWARFAPNGRKLVWASSAEVRGGAAPIDRADMALQIPTDLWLMDERALAVERLTHFNDVFSPDYVGPTIVGAPAWSLDGDRFLVSVAPAGDPARSDLFLVRLSEPLGR